MLTFRRDTALSLFSFELFTKVDQAQYNSLSDLEQYACQREFELERRKGVSDLLQLPAQPNGLAIAQRTWEVHMDKRLTVHDPRGYPPKVTGKRLAPRLEALEGKLIYLVDCLFENSDVFMDQLQRWFTEHLPAVKTRIVRPGASMREFTPSRNWADDPDMLAKIRADGDGAVLGVGL